MTRQYLLLQQNLNAPMPSTISEVARVVHRLVWPWFGSAMATLLNKWPETVYIYIWFAFALVIIPDRYTKQWNTIVLLPNLMEIRFMTDWASLLWINLKPRFQETPT